MYSVVVHITYIYIKMRRTQIREIFFLNICRPVKSLHVFFQYMYNYVFFCHWGHLNKNKEIQFWNKNNLECNVILPIPSLILPSTSPYPPLTAPYPPLNLHLPPLREDTHKKVVFLVVRPLRFYPPYTNGLVVHATFFL